MTRSLGCSVSPRRRRLPFPSSFYFFSCSPLPAHSQDVDVAIMNAKGKKGAQVVTVLAQMGGSADPIGKMRDIKGDPNLAFVEHPLNYRVVQDLRLGKKENHEVRAMPRRGFVG